MNNSVTCTYHVDFRYGTDARHIHCDTDVHRATWIHAITIASLCLSCRFKHNYSTNGVFRNQNVCLVLLHMPTIVCLYTSLFTKYMVAITTRKTKTNNTKDYRHTKKKNSNYINIVNFNFWADLLHRADPRSHYPSNILRLKIQLFGSIHLMVV